MSELRAVSEDQARELLAKTGLFVPSLGGPGAERPTPSGRLKVWDIKEVADRVATSPRREWLIDPLWSQDDYGALGGAEKTGKTWAVQDLAVSVTTGTPWLGHFPCPTPGGALFFSGEGGEAGTVRRLTAILQGRDPSAGLDELSGSLRLCFTVPRLTDREALEEVRRELGDNPARLVVLDPLYLAARGARGSDLYAMGEVLYEIQCLCQEARAALVVVPHWNKTGGGTGAERFTGTGLQQWGRVLGSASVERRTTDPDGASHVLLKWEFTGGEISDLTFRVRRRVWAEDPHDPNSALHYEAQVTQVAEPVEAGGDLSHSQRRVLAALAAKPGQSVGDLQEAVANDGRGRPLRTRTIQDALAELEKLGLATGSESLPGLPRYWTAE